MGRFSVTIPSKQLCRGLRPAENMPRNTGFMVKCVGAVGKEKVLQALESLTRLDTSVITDAFPFPQIFIFTNMIIVCGLKKIYEYVGGSLVLKYTATTPGSVWSAVDFYDYVYMSNGREAVIRDAASKAYALDATQPTATAICNYNGQVLIGSPGVREPGIDLMKVANPGIATANGYGSAGV